MTLLERGAINKSVMQPHYLSLHLMVRSVGRTRNRSDEGKRGCYFNYDGGAVFGEVSREGEKEGRGVISL